MGILVGLPRKNDSERTLELNLANYAENEMVIDAPFLPAEWYEQSGIQLTWPHRNTDWGYMLDEVES